LKISPEHEFLFKTTGAKRYIAKKQIPRANAVISLSYDDRPRPGDRDKFLFADDPRCLNITETLVKRLGDEFPVDVLPSGFAGPSAVPSDWNKLLNVSGYGGDPLPIPVYNNQHLIASMGLANKIRPADVPWFKELVRLFFGAAVPADLHIRKAASTGFPWFTTDNEYKKLGTIKCLHNIDDWLASMSGDKQQSIRALEIYDSIPVFAIQKRQQPDAVSLVNGVYKSKDRPFPTEEEARSGNYEAKRFVNKTVYDYKGNMIEGHFAMRQRTVFGMSGIPNYVMTAVMGCFREVYLNRFAFTYKTRDDADKEEKISRYKFTVGSDVKQMDTTVPDWFLELLYEELPKYWDERLVVVLRRMMKAPYVVPSPWVKTPEDYNPVFGPSPLEGNSFDASVGLPSGIFINPDIGKLWMTFVYSILYRDVGALRVVSELEPFLQGKNSDHALLDMSDDAAMLTNNQLIAAQLKEGKSPYAVLEPETPVLYLGSVFAEVDGKKRSFPNPVTYVVNMLAREDSIDKINPVNHAEGVLARYQQYSRTPIFRDLNQITEEVIRKYAGVNPYLMARSMAKRQRFNDVDALVIANPHYLNYRVDPKTVSKEVLDEIVATIPAINFFDRIRHLFKVPTTSIGEVNG